MTTLRSDYLAACAALKALSTAVVESADAAFEPPPGMVVSKGETGSNVADVSNPTLDTVLDPRRLALSEEVTLTSYALRELTVTITARTRALDRALARWAGETG